MADAFVKVMVSSGRRKQLRQIRDIYGIEPGEFLGMMIDAYPGNLVDLTANMDMVRARAELEGQSAIIVPDEAEVLAMPPRPTTSVEIGGSSRPEPQPTGDDKYEIKVR